VPDTCLWGIGGGPACVALFVLVQTITMTIALTTWRTRTALTSGGTCSRLRPD